MYFKDDRFSERKKIDSKPYQSLWEVAQGPPFTFELIVNSSGGACEMKTA